MFGFSIINHPALGVPPFMESLGDCLRGGSVCGKGLVIGSTLGSTSKTIYFRYAPHGSYWGRTSQIFINNSICLALEICSELSRLPRRERGPPVMTDTILSYDPIYPLVNIQKTLENHHFQWVNPP